MWLAWVAAIACAGNARAQEDPSQFLVKKSLLVIAEVDTYDEALRLARLSAQRLELRLDLRRLSADPELGLTLSEAECTENGWEHPCYVPRGRFDDGVYVSIEHSRGYRELTAGYVVVAASGPVDDLALQALFHKTSKRFRTASLRTVEVYMGCLH
jgi:hypothetical protein